MNLYTRQRVSALLALLTAVALIIGTAAPSLANGGQIYETPGGQARPTDYDKPGGPPKDLEFWCHDVTGGQHRGNYGATWMGPFIRCADDPTPGYTNYFRLCQPALQVFRFYGNVDNPAIGWATSMAAREKWCEDEFDPMYLWTTSGYDAKSNELGPNNADRRAVGQVSVPDLGIEPRTRINRRGMALGPQYASEWNIAGLDGTLDGAPNDDIPTLVTAGRPFAGNDGCVDAETPNVIAERLDDPATPAEEKDAILQSLASRLDRGTKTIARRLGLRLEDQRHADLAAKLARKYTGILSVDLVNGRVRFDPNPCDSPARYISQLDIAEYGQARNLDMLIGNRPLQRQFTVTGVCYIPIEAMSRAMRVTDTGVMTWQFPTIRNGGFGGGLRYSNYYTQAGMTYTASKFRNQIPELHNDLERKVLDEYRAVMRKWYLDTTAPGNLDALMNQWDQQEWPAQPYPVTNIRKRIPDVAAIRANDYARQEAADTLANDSRCRFGPRFYAADPPPDIEPPDVVGDLTIRNQAVQQSDGYGTEEQKFTVSDNGIECKDTCDGYAINFMHLDYTVTIAAPGDWKLSYGDSPKQNGQDAHVWADVSGGSVQSASCSGSTCTLSIRGTSQGSVLTVESRYFRQTRPAQRVKVTLSGPVATFEQLKDYYYDVSVDDGEGGQMTVTVCDCGVREEKTTTDFSVAGGPAETLESGRSWSYEMRVLGAQSTM